jgi:uncharacterized protein (TIGR02266 family)
MSAVVSMPTATNVRDLAELESRLAREESELATQIARATTLLAGIRERAAGVQERARRLAEQNPRVTTPPVRALQTPVLDVSGELAELQRIRAAAVNARAKVHENMRSALERYATQLQQLTTGLDADARALEQASTAAQDAAKAETIAASVQQRRRHKRVPLKAVVDMKSENNFWRGFSIDVGEGGVFVATFDALPKDSVVELMMTLPDGREVHATGQVRWTREWNDNTPEVYPGMGIQFLHVEEDGTESIRRFVEVRDPMFYAD